MNDPIVSLLRALRRRLWLQRARIGARRAVWAACVCTLGVGIIHRWLMATPLVIALALAVAPGLAIALLTFVRGRPKLDESARHADRLLGTQELITSAWEIRSAAGVASRTAAIVTARAAGIAAAGLPKVAPAAGTGRSFALPVALAFAGTFLLLNRGAETGAATDSRGAALAHDGAPATPLDDRAVFADKAAATAESRERPTVETDGIVLPDPLEIEDGPTPLLLPDESGSRSGAAEELGKLSADGRPPPRASSEVALAEIEVRIVSVASLESAPEAATGSDGVELDATAAERLGISTGTGTVPRTTALADWSRLTAGERMLADRYFSLTLAEGELDPDGETNR